MPTNERPVLFQGLLGARDLTMSPGQEHDVPPDTACRTSRQLSRG